MTSRATGGDIDVVSPPTPGMANARIAILADGGWIVTYATLFEDGSNYGIFQQRYDAFGAPVGGEVLVNTQVVGFQFHANAEGLPDGGWLVLWADSSSGTAVIKQQRYDALGLPVGGETLLSGGGTATTPDIAVLSDGGWLVSWVRAGIAGNDVYQQRFDADGDPVGSEQPVNTHIGGNQADAEVIALDNGGWVVVWTSDGQLGAQTEIYQQRYDASGVPVGTETLVNTTTANAQIESSSTALADGGWLVTWVGSDGATTQIFQQRFDADGARSGPEILVNEVGANIAHASVVVTALSDGGWVLAYVSETATNAVVQQRFDQFGNAIGGETLVSPLGNEVTPAIAATPDGGWTIVWRSFVSVDFALVQRHYAPDIYGTIGADTLTGTHWVETLFGLAGNDVLDGGAGRDIMVGGFGDDTYHVDHANDEVRELFGQGTDTVISATTFSLLPAQAENLTLTASTNINGIGNGLANALTGNAGVNTLNGLNGNDTLDGADGNDTLNGGAGNDVLIGGAGNDRLAGNAGRDTATYASAASGVTVTLASILAQNTIGAGLDTLIDVENLIGSAHNDTLTGSDFDNDIEGGSGNDTMSGGNGTDTLIYANSASGVTVRLGQTTAQHTIGAGADTISGFENVIGSAFDDILAGNAGNNLFEGGAGIDQIDGNGGTDTATFASIQIEVFADLSAATPQANYGAEYDRLISIENLIGSAFNDVFTGSAGANQLEGRGGRDGLNGGDGADKLIGGRDGDYLTGGAGADRFIFDDGDTASDSFNADRIFDFSTAEGDRIALSQMDANALVAGDQAFTLIGTGAFTETAGELRYESDATFTYLYGDTNGDSLADFCILLSPGLVLSASDFIL